MKGEVSKESVVFRRRESETRKFGIKKSDEELTLETPASEYFCGHNMTLVNLFE